MDLIPPAPVLARPALSRLERRSGRRRLLAMRSRSGAALCFAFAAFPAAAFPRRAGRRFGRARGAALRAKKPAPMPETQRVYPAKDLCSRCGLCNTSLISKVQSACAFLGHGMLRIDSLESRVHGRQRTEEELYFGVAQHGIHSIRTKPQHAPKTRTAWTGVVTAIACEMLRSNKVDAVLCVASKGDGAQLEPKPILARTEAEVLSSGGVKPMLSPNLLPLEELWQVRGGEIRRLLFIGVGCQVQALRAVEEDLGLEELYVLGTNCVDNPRSPEALQRFLKSASEFPDTAAGFEFMQDNRIHVKHSDGRYERIPVFSLKDPQMCTGVIAKSCYACFDYVNALTDLTVGYMGAPWEGKEMTQHSQYCVVRNAKGQEMLEIAKDRLRMGEVDLEVPGRVDRFGLLPQVLKPELDLAFGRRKASVGPPRWLAELLCELLTRLGPQGLDFARASIERATVRNLVCLEAMRGQKGSPRTSAELGVPRHAARIREKYQDLYEELLAAYSDGTVQ
ncbi:unnamed protein product [Effrenium voratum]|uniref:Coenzyme F420 hydrogenase n=1 Tax=Effrenium voratum TaxID=2562239 RepID=A0AA36I3Y1_9DINO|nr:unnamed protein product [Effrenium voratum]